MGLQEHRRRTRAAYDAAAESWTKRNVAKGLDEAERLRAEVDGPILDLGCGQGLHLEALRPAIGVDISFEMLRRSSDHPLIQADLSSLPLRRESMAGAWASRSLVHVPRTEMPLALAELHRVVEVDGQVSAWLFAGDAEATERDADVVPGRTFSFWPTDLLSDVFTGAGFEVTSMKTWKSDEGHGQITVRARRLWSLPNFVGPNMKLLVCGLNPSPSSADHGVGYHRAGNRFWPAALAAGLATVDRDPGRALHQHGLGMTDLAKRTTRRADELTADEYRTGVSDLTRLVEWLQPEAICMVGLAGWRAAIDRKAQRGWQPNELGGRPVYLMPSTSGLNAHDTIDSLADHLRAAAARP